MTLLEISRIIDLEKIAIASHIIAVGVLVYLFFKDSKKTHKPSKKKVFKH